MAHQLKMFAVFFVSATIMSLTREVNGEHGYIAHAGRAIIMAVTFFSTIGYALSLAQADSQKNIIGIHFAQGLFRGALMAFMPLVLFIQQRDWTNLLLIPFAYSVFYLFFELALNKLKDSPMFYVGNQALMDRTVRWLNERTFLLRLWPAWFAFVKVMLILLSLAYIVRYYL